MMGINVDECDKVATLIGLKTVINEFVAYQALGDMIKEGQISVSQTLG
jgi:pyrimidine nucleoside transport protein